MKVIKQVGPQHDDRGQAQDALVGISVMPGYVFGFVDANNRCISFHQTAPGQLQRGQQEVELVFAPLPQLSSEALAESLKPIADLIFGAKKAPENACARLQELRKVLEEAHTDWEADEESRFRKDFREWLEEAKADPCHPYHLEAKEYLALEDEASGVSLSA